MVTSHQTPEVTSEIKEQETIKQANDKIQAVKDAKAKADAEAAAKAEAEKVNEQRRAEAEKQQADKKAQQARVTTQLHTTASTSQQNTAPSVSDSTINMNQTSGQVDVAAVSQWLATHKGTFSASKWAAIIMRESNGQVNARNSSSGAYGVLQLLGHGEYPGMTLGQQLSMAMNLPASAWALTNY